MTTEAGRVRAVFDQAFEIASSTERIAYLDRACAGNTELRREIESLLRAHDQAGDFMNRPACEETGAEFAVIVPSSAADGDFPIDFLVRSSRSESLGRLGHYEIQEVLGRGGFGIVFKAFDERLHRVVAIKVLGPRLTGSANARRRFLREARSAAAVRSDYVVDIHAVEEQPIPYLVMEYIAGQTLQQKLAGGGPLRQQEVLSIGEQIAQGLAAAHRQGLIHRDIKPGNILLENGVERVKITDFGLARAADDDSSLTQSGVIAGTPMYMAPEQAQGEAVDHRTDLFSLGSVLYAMCTGKPPFRGSSTLAVLKRVCDDAPQPIREINPEAPEWLCALIARLHAKKPDDRLASACEVADVLAGRLSELQAPGGARKTAPLGLPRRSRAKWLWGAAAAIVVPLIGLGLTETTGLTRLFAPPIAAPVVNRPPAPIVVPFSAEQAGISQEAWAQYLDVGVETTNSIGMKFQLIPPGEYFMTPEYRARISKPFRLSRFETTVAQFRAFVQETSYKTDAEASGEGALVRNAKGEWEQRPEYTWRHPDVAQGDDYPVAQLSWHDCDEFCRWLSRKESRTYRLPTDAEWEWACRAGSDATYSFGDHVKDLGDYAWYDANSEDRSHPVGQKKPNAWGLHDMHGNLAEYCLDWEGDLPTGERTDPRGPAPGRTRVIRGYGFFDTAHGVRTATRASFVPTESMYHFGFRVLCELP